MNTDNYKSAVAQTINNLLNPNKSNKSEKSAEIDMGGFVSSIKKELLNLKVPVYDVRVSTYRHNVLVLELPFCKSCEIAVDPVEFGNENKQVTLYIDKKAVRRIKLEKIDSKYMNEIAIALVDYFKRYLLLRNKFEK